MFGFSDTTWFGVKLGGAIVYLCYVIFREILWTLLVAFPALTITFWMMMLLKTVEGI